MEDCSPAQPVRSHQLLDSTDFREIHSKEAAAGKEELCTIIIIIIIISVKHLQVVQMFVPYLFREIAALGVVTLSAHRCAFASRM